MKDRFRFNPIEGSVLCVMIMILCHSVFSLVFGIENLRAAPLGTGSQSVAMSFETGVRKPASPQNTFRSIDFKCEDASSAVEPLSATKIRLSGPLCGSPSPTAKLLKTQIVNGANKYAATVFTDVSAQKFSTDFIPLIAGRNAIYVEFSYQGGKTFSREFAVERN